MARKYLGSSKGWGRAVQPDSSRFFGTSSGSKIAGAVLKVDTAPLSLLTLIRLGQSLPLTYSLDYLIRSFNEDNFRGELQETRGEQHVFTGRQRDGAIR
jgi:hypothetical protein